ncbi:hypothetical protein PMAYCL1PPCAC_28878, partial [Pristionchus mayeri]
MTILPVACLNRVFENDVVNSLCILLSMKMRFDHDPDTLQRASAVYDQMINVIIEMWDQGFGAACRTLKCHLSLVHGARDYNMWGTCVELSANSFESANRILKTNMPMTLQHDLLHRRFLQSQYVLDLLYCRLDDESCDDVKEELFRSIDALSHTSTVVRGDSLSSRFKNITGINRTIMSSATSVWHRCVFRNVMYCSEESQNSTKSDHSIVLYRRGCSVKVGVCQFFH